MKEVLKNNKLVLMEGAMVERLKRIAGIVLDVDLVHAPLIYSADGKKALSQLYQEYADIALGQKLPILLCSPTWRTNEELVKKSHHPHSINRDAIKFLKDFRARQKSESKSIFIGGLIGCKNDSYKPEKGLSAEEAENFHRWQIEEFAAEKPDFLIAVTLPNTIEALGMAKAFMKTDIPFFISFVINRDGKVLDGTPLGEAISTIDQLTSGGPTGYLVNCSHPTFLKKAELSAKVRERFLGIQANASSLDHSKLDGSDSLHVDDIKNWGREMIALHKDQNIQILGGCCGTDARHLKSLFD